MKSIVIKDSTSKKKIYDLSFNQIEILEFLYNKTYDKNEYTKEMLREIKKKHCAYKSQDKIKCKFDKEKHITLDEIISKLYKSKLKCYYCNCALLIIYNKIKQNTQWTLERFDNNKGHYSDNTCISCLKCNLQRRTDNHIYFKQGKNLIIKKIDSQSSNNEIEIDELIDN
jgi:hypothetical protein